MKEYKLIILIKDKTIGMKEESSEQLKTTDLRFIISVFEEIKLKMLQSIIETEIIPKSSEKEHIQYD